MSDIAKLEKTLQKLTEEDTEPSKILHVVERLLSLKPNHRMALSCKVVCHMYQEKFGAAIAALDQLVASDKSTAQQPTVVFQRAYCLYRMQQVAEAKAVLLKSPALSTHVPSRHLLGQIHYNLEDYTAAADIYKRLLEDRTYRDEQEQAELLGNYTAALALGDKPAEALQAVRTAEDKTADILYNAAVAQIQANDFSAAHQTLLQAEATYKLDHPQTSVKNLEEALTLTPEQVDAVLGPVHGAAVNTQHAATRAFLDEVAPTWVQLAYTAYSQHDEPRAVQILELVLRAKPASAVTLAMASVNLAALRSNSKKDFFDSQKRLKSAQQPRVTARMTRRQLRAVRYNMALLNLQFGSINVTRRVVEQMEQDDAESELTASLRLALAMHDAKKKKQQSADELIQAFVQRKGRRPEGGAQAQLVASQLYLQQGDLARAVEALKAAANADASLAEKPSTTATIAAWQVQLDDMPAAIATLERAIKASDAATAESLLVWAVHFLATSRRLYAEAAALVRSSQTAVPALAKRPEVTALLMMCLSYTDLPAARACRSELGVSSSAAASATLSEARVETLQKQNPGRDAMSRLGYQREVATGAATGEGTGLAAPGARTRRRRKLRRPAKNMDGKPDPERWIPMAVRSYVKDLPERRKRELKRLRAQEQEQKRRAAEKAKKSQQEGTQEVA